VNIVGLFSCAGIGPWEKSAIGFKLTVIDFEIESIMLHVPESMATRLIV
jgi:hypothetical protein